VGVNLQDTNANDNHKPDPVNEGVLILGSTSNSQLLEPLQPAESRPASATFVTPALNLWNAKWVLLKRIDVQLFIKHLQTNSPQKGDPQQWPESDRQEWPRVNDIEYF
jgi:hypothetical protein